MVASGATKRACDRPKKEVQELKFDSTELHPASLIPHPISLHSPSVQLPLSRTASAIKRLSESVPPLAVRAATAALQVAKGECALDDTAIHTERLHDHVLRAADNICSSTVHESKYKFSRPDSSISVAQSKTPAATSSSRRLLFASPKRPAGHTASERHTAMQSDVKPRREREQKKLKASQTSIPSAIFDTHDNEASEQNANVPERQSTRSRSSTPEQRSVRKKRRPKQPKARNLSDGGNTAATKNQSSLQKDKTNIHPEGKPGMDGAEVLDFLKPAPDAIRYDVQKMPSKGNGRLLPVDVDSSDGGKCSNEEASTASHDIMRSRSSTPEPRIVGKKRRVRHAKLDTQHVECETTVAKVPSTMQVFQMNLCCVDIPSADQTETVKPVERRPTRVQNEVGKTSESGGTSRKDVGKHIPGESSPNINVAAKKMKRSLSSTPQSRNMKKKRRFKPAAVEISRSEEARPAAQNLSSIGGGETGKDKLSASFQLAKALNSNELGNDENQVQGNRAAGDAVSSPGSALQTRSAKRKQYSRPVRFKIQGEEVAKSAQVDPSSLTDDEECVSGRLEHKQGNFASMRRNLGNTELNHVHEKGNAIHEHADGRSKVERTTVDSSSDRSPLLDSMKSKQTEMKRSEVPSSEGETDEVNSGKFRRGRAKTPTPTKSKKERLVRRRIKQEPKESSNSTDTRKRLSEVLRLQKSLETAVWTDSTAVREQDDVIIISDEEDTESKQTSTPIRSSRRRRQAAMSRAGFSYSDRSRRVKREDITAPSGESSMYSSPKRVELLERTNNGVPPSKRNLDADLERATLVPDESPTSLPESHSGRARKSRLKSTNSEISPVKSIKTRTEEDMKLRCGSQRHVRREKRNRDDQDVKKIHESEDLAPVEGSEFEGEDNGRRHNGLSRSRYESSGRSSKRQRREEHSRMMRSQKVSQSEKSDGHISIEAPETRNPRKKARRSADKDLENSAAMALDEMDSLEFSGSESEGKPAEEQCDPHVLEEKNKQARSRVRKKVKPRRR